MEARDSSLEENKEASQVGEGGNVTFQTNTSAAAADATNTNGNAGNNEEGGNNQQDQDERSARAEEVAGRGEIKFTKEILSSMKWLPELPLNVPRRHKKKRDTYNPIAAGVKNVLSQKEDTGGFQRKVKIKNFGGQLALTADKDKPAKEVKEGIKKLDPDKAKYLKYMPCHFLGNNRSRRISSKDNQYIFPKEELKDSLWRVGHIRFNPNLSFLGGTEEGSDFSKDHYSSSDEGGEEQEDDKQEAEEESAPPTRGRNRSTSDAFNDGTGNNANLQRKASLNQTGKKGGIDRKGSVRNAGNARGTVSSRKSTRGSMGKGEMLPPLDGDPFFTPRDNMENIREFLIDDPEEVILKAEQLLVPITEKCLFPTSPSQKQVANSNGTSKYTSRQRTPARPQLVRQTSLNNHVFGLDEKRAQVHNEYKHIFADIKNLDSTILSVRKDIKAANHNVLSEEDWALIMEGKYTIQKGKEKQALLLASALENEGNVVTEPSGANPNNINYTLDENQNGLHIWGEPQYTNAQDLKEIFSEMQTLERKRLFKRLTERRYQRYLSLCNISLMTEKMKRIEKQLSGHNNRKWRQCKRPINLWKKVPQMVQSQTPEEETPQERLITSSEARGRRVSLAGTEGFPASARSRRPSLATVADEPGTSGSGHEATNLADVSEIGEEQALASQNCEQPEGITNGIE
eukprot:Nk52_evm7s262 gene=Nk52_evmTU7s262